MIVFLIFSVLATVITFGLSLLPCGILSDVCTSPTLPLPTAVTDGFTYAGHSAHYLVYLFGSTVGDAEVTCFLLLLSVGIIMVLWNILLNFRVPIISDVVARLRGSKQETV